MATTLSARKKAAAERVLNDTRKIWFYRDPQGQTQGPYSVADLMIWLRCGYFDATLPLSSDPLTISFCPMRDILAAAIERLSATLGETVEQNEAEMPEGTRSDSRHLDSLGFALNAIDAGSAWDRHDSYNAPSKMFPYTTDQNRTMPSESQFGEQSLTLAMVKDQRGVAGWSRTEPALEHSEPEAKQSGEMHVASSLRNAVPGQKTDQKRNEGIRNRNRQPPPLDHEESHLQSGIATSDMSRSSKALSKGKPTTPQEHWIPVMHSSRSTAVRHASRDSRPQDLEPSERALEEAVNFKRSIYEDSHIRVIPRSEADAMSKAATSALTHDGREREARQDAYASYRAARISSFTQGSAASTDDSSSENHSHHQEQYPNQKKSFLDIQREEEERQRHEFAARMKTSPSNFSALHSKPLTIAQRLAAGLPRSKTVTVGMPKSKETVPVSISQITQSSNSVAPWSGALRTNSACVSTTHPATNAMVERHKVGLDSQNEHYAERASVSAPKRQNAASRVFDGSVKQQNQADWPSTTPSSEFTRWCEQALTQLSGDPMPELMGFLYNTEASQVAEYVQLYLGNHPDCVRFADEFSRRREFDHTPSEPNHEPSSSTLLERQSKGRSKRTTK